MNKLILFTLLGILISFCSKKAPVDYKNYAFLFQTTSSGNCAVIQKKVENGNTIYTASARAVSSGACRESSFYTITSNVDEAKQSSDAYYSNMALSFNKYPECSELTKAAVGFRETISVASIEAEANKSSNGCTNITSRVIFCKDANSLTSFRNNFRYQTISNAKADMATNYQSMIAINGSVNKLLDLKYEEAVIGNLRIANAGEISLYEGADSSTLPISFAENQTCFRKVINGNANLKTAYTKIPVLQEFFKEEITNSNRFALTETIVPSLSCVYGTNIVGVGANGISPAVGVCPSSYPTF